MTYYVETTEMDVSILSDGVGKPFPVRPVADDDLTVVTVLHYLELIKYIRNITFCICYSKGCNYSIQKCLNFLARSE